MTAPQTEATTGPQDTITGLQQRLDAALAREAALTDALARRNSEYGERIEYQSATIDVLKAMSASPGDPQPVFDLIARRARELCNGTLAGLFEVDGDLLQLRSSSSSSNDATALAMISAQFPMRLTRGTAACRAVLEKRVIHIRNVDADPYLSQVIRDSGSKSILSLPLMLDGTAIGAINLNDMEPGGYSDSQIELLKTLAEQAVIAITSAQTHRALQTRTADLQQSLEYQTATSDVLKVISRSAFDLQPVLDTLVETATRLCNADQAVIFRREGELWRLSANFGFPPEFEAAWRELGAVPLDRNSAAAGWRTIRERRPVHIHDAATVPGYLDTVGIGRGKQRTALAVPLLREGEVIGNIVLARQHVEPFTDRQIELVSTFADQAVIAIENTRLMTEQREALEQQTATAEVLQVINASPANLAPVFDAILANAMHLCETAFGMFNAYDGTSFRTVVTRGVPAAFAEFRAKHPPYPGRPDSPFARAVETRRPVHVVDWLEEPVYKEGTPGGRAIADLGGARTVLNVPLVKDTAVLGMVSFYRQQVRPYSGAHIALLQNFAAQAVIAMENARLLTEQREALEQQTATAEVLQVINSSPGNLAPVFDAMLEKAMHVCEAAFGQLWSYDGEHLHVTAVRGVPAAYEHFLKQGPHRPSRFQRRVMYGEPFEQIADLTLSDAYRAGEPLARAGADLGGTRTLLAVPLRKDGKALGIIGIYRQEVRPFTKKQITLLQNFAAQAVIAMENARLIAETREALEQQTATAEVLQVINSSPGNLAPVFEVILEKAHQLCDSVTGNLVLFDGAQFRRVAYRGMSGNVSAMLTDPLRFTDERWHLIRGERFIHVSDLDAPEAPRSEVLEALRGHEGVRSYILVPMRKDGALLGYISSNWTQPRPNVDKEVRLLESFAAQAVIAMENARLINEQREALEQQTATAEVLRVINSSPGNLAPVFDAMLEKATRLCQAEMGTFWTYDGEYMQPAAMRGVPPSYAEFLKEGPHRPNWAQTRILRGERVTQTVDITESEAYRSGDPLARAGADLGGIRTVLVVPLLKDDAVHGTIGIYRQEPRPFTDKQITLLQNFAAQAVIAVENARLLTEQREALEQQTATAQVLGVINASPGDLTPVFDAILEKAHRLCGATHGCLTLFDGERFRAVATYGHSEVWAERLREGLPAANDPGTGPLLDGARFVHLPDVLDIKHPLTQAAAETTGVRTALFVPLRRDNKLIGAISAHRREVRPFTEKEIALIENFAAQAVIAMENARLLTETREALEQQTATAEVLQVINASPGNLVPVFEAILDKAHGLCGAVVGSLLIYDGARFHAEATHGQPEDVSAILSRPFRPNSFLRRLVLGEHLVHIPDFKAASVQEDHELTRSTRSLTDIRTSLWVPLRKDGQLLGCISAFRLEVRPFSEREIALLENFAAQAVIAMENARLLNEVRQRQEELRITFENMGDGVALFDETRHLVASNQRFRDMLEVPDDVIASRPAFSDYIRYLADHGEYGPEPEDHVQQLLAHGSQQRTFERTRPNGRIIEIKVNPVAGGGFVVIYSDITERKRSEAEIRAARDAAEEASRTIEAAYRDLKAAQANLIQAEKMASLGQLTAGIAHEIKNPLNFVNNFASLSVDLLDELKQTAAPAFAMLDEARRVEIDDLTRTLSGNLEKINEHGNRADAIVRSMLEHSRGSSGERRPVNLNTLVDEALNLAYHGARAQDQSFNITLERDFDRGIAPITLVPQDVTRVLLNLFSNGFYAARRRQGMEPTPGFEPMLKVATRELGDAVEIRVRDNGIGIPEEVKDKLFQPFFTTKPTGEGTGLGLSISYDIVTQQHGGSITVDSKVGEYSELAIRLPRNR
jgi:GAF domain-containing protein/nitrogen-specific signal transduction histidine kinase